VLRLVAALQVSASQVGLRREEGQTMAEYGVVLAVIVLACVAAITLLSGNVRAALTSVANILPGG
jgi:Flp pilus assembly pilin Flp